MYSKTSREKLSSTAKAGAVILLPAKGSAPKDALAAVCDGCGAQIWILSDFKDMLEEGNHKTFCLQCLQVRKAV